MKLFVRHSRHFLYVKGHVMNNVIIYFGATKGRQKGTLYYIRNMFFFDGLVLVRAETFKINWFRCVAKMCAARIFFFFTESLLLKVVLLMCIIRIYLYYLSWVWLTVRYTCYYIVLHVRAHTMCVCVCDDWRNIVENKWTTTKEIYFSEKQRRVSKQKRQRMNVLPIGGYWGEFGGDYTPPERNQTTSDVKVNCVF
jgi:hypothetical protein